MSAREYKVTVAAEFADAYTDWTRVEETGVRWFKVVPREDETAEVWLNSGEDQPRDDECA